MKEIYNTALLTTIFSIIFNYRLVQSFYSSYGSYISPTDTNLYIVVSAELNIQGPISRMNGTQETSHLHGTRERPGPDGGSYLPVEAESSKVDRLKNLEITLAATQKKLEISELERENLKSSLRVQESKLLQENRDLKERLRKSQEEVDYLKLTQADSASLQGTPQLMPENRGAKDTLPVKTLQKLVPLLRQYKMRVANLNNTITQQSQTLQTLSKHLKGGGDHKRLPASMESSVGSNMGLSTNMNLTLSLASTPTGRAPDTESRHLPAQRLDRFTPKDNTYANTDDYLRRDHGAPQTLVNDTGSRLSEEPKTSSARKAPVPMPRSRTSLRTSSPSIAVIDSHSTGDGSFQIVDKPSHYPATRIQQSTTLDMITEQPLSPISLTELPPIQSNISNQPNELNQNVVQVQTCDVCHTKFPHLTEREFLDHCIECADRATEEEIGLSMTGIIRQETGHAYLKTCPVCQNEFGKDVSQTDYENHVQGHFIHEEPRLPGWEAI